MSDKRKFNGYYYQQLNHNRMNLMTQPLSATELGGLFKIILLVGMSRQQFDFADGSMSANGARMKTTDLIEWLTGNIPRLSAKQAGRIVNASLDHKLLEVTAAGYIRLKDWRSDQKAPPTAGASRKREYDNRQRMRTVRELLRKYDGKKVDRKSLRALFKEEAGYSQKISDGLRRALLEEGVLVAAGQGIWKVFAAAVVSNSAPSARPAPREGEGSDEHDIERYLKHLDGVTSNDNSDHNHTETKVSHDHETDRPSSRSGGSEPTDPLSVDGGAGRAEGGSPDIYAVTDDELAETVCVIFQPREWAKTRDILKSKLSALRKKIGPRKAGEVFREIVSAVQTDLRSTGAKRLREPEKEITARINDRLGLPRRTLGKS